MRGCKPVEVRAFLENIADEIDRLHLLIEEQKRDAALMRKQFEEAQTLESSVAKMLEQIEKKTDAVLVLSKLEMEKEQKEIGSERGKILQNAREEASLITREAEHKSKVFLTNANAQLKRIQDQITMLHARRVALIARIKSVLISQVEFLDALNRDIEKPRAESLEYSDVDVSKHGIDAAHLESIVKRLEEMEALHP